MTIKIFVKVRQNVKMEISSIAEYVEIISSLNSSFQRNGAEKNEVMLFRGQSNVEYELLPSLGRNRETPCDITVFNEERNLIEMAKYKLPDIFNNALTPIELLALLQHYGIPTRLLDISENALVALFFACFENEKQDGEVIVFKHNELHIANYPMINAIAESYKYASSSFCRLADFYEKVSIQTYFDEQRNANEIRYASSTEAANWVEECCKSPIFVYAPIRSLRQQLQQGRYILFPNKISNYGDSGEKCFESIIEPMSKECECVVARIQIAAEKKDAIIRELTLFGISEATLFADSADIVCKNIKNRFTEKITYANVF